MNGAHLHLLVNHVSLFALVIGTVALAGSMKRGTADLRILASALFVMVGVFGWIAFETGEQAEDVVKTLSGDFDSLIEQHEQAAIWALRSGFLVASLALVMEFAAWKKKTWLKVIQWVLLIGAIHGSTVYATTAFLGGKIRHTEIRD